MAINYIPSNGVVEDHDVFQIMESIGIYIPKEIFQKQIAKLQNDNTENMFQDFIHRTANKITIHYN
jgi:Ca2+-binding EF-hand superfamily protein